MLKAKEKSVNNIAAGITGLFKKNKVEWIKGWGKITSADTIEINDTKKSEAKTIKAKNIVIATGSISTAFPGIEVCLYYYYIPFLTIHTFPKIDEEQIVSSTGALSLSKVPENLVILGGGIIGLEFASIWSRLGSNVTVIEYTDVICGQIIDASISKSLTSSLKKQGIVIKTGTKALGVSKTNDGKIILKTENNATKEQNEVSILFSPSSICSKCLLLTPLITGNQ